jgi:hypothetical protein
MIIMHAVDNDGLTTTISRRVDPIIVFVDIDSEPQNMTVLVDDLPVTTPQQITSWAKHNLHLSVEDQTRLKFASWADGGERSHLVHLSDNSQPSLFVSFCMKRFSKCTSSLQCCSGLCAFGHCKIGMREEDQPKKKFVRGGA